jgi:two-component system, OmpR family, phosphate regulon sensor histidine kinase PhoR
MPTDPNGTAAGGAMTERKASNAASIVRDWVERARAVAGGVKAPGGDAAPGEEGPGAWSAELQAALDRMERERRRFEELFRDAPIPYLITDWQGRITDANDAASALLSKPSERLAGTPLSAYVHDTAELARHLDGLAQTGRINAWEAELRPSSGGRIPARVSASTAMAPSAAEPEIRWVLRDARPELATRERQRRLHRERMATSAVERIANRARFLSDASARLMGVLNPDAVWDIAAEVVTAHAAGVVLLERSVEDDGRLAVRSTGGGSMAGAVAALRDRVLDVEREAEEGEAVLPFPDMRAALRDGEPRMTPAAGDAGSVAGVLVLPIVAQHRVVGLMVVWPPVGRRLDEELLMHRTLAERVGLALEAAMLFEEVVRARRHAEEATAAESDFLAMVSHELRTPLTAIISYSELLGDSADDMPAHLKRYASQIAEAARHQRKLVEQILSYKQVQREGPGEPESLDFREVAQFSVTMVRPQAEGKPVEVVAVLPPDAVEGVCDPGKLRQILANLLSNAIRHTRRGTVRLSVTEEDPYVVIEVTDTGDGIAAEELPRIFDRFWRGSGPDRERGGSGLGLTITRELVSRMGGKIAVESAKGAGSTFTVWIPRVAGQ